MVEKIINQKNAIMGIAIIIIMVFHTNMAHRIFCIYGPGAVELFLLLSAFTIPYSYYKNGIRTFLWHRFNRIIPAYLLVASTFYMFYYFQETYSFTQTIKHICGYSFYSNGVSHFWFIHLIIICYLLTPFVLKLYDKYRIMLYLFPLLSFSVVSYFFTNNMDKPFYSLMVCRIPTYISGLSIYCMSKDSRKYIVKDSVISIISIILFIVCIAYLYFYNVTFPYLLYLCINLSFMIIVSHIHLSHFLQKIGTLTLECYLLHQFIILEYMKNFLTKETTLTPLSISFTIVCAILLKNSIHKVYIPFLQRITYDTLKAIK